VGCSGRSAASQRGKESGRTEEKRSENEVRHALSLSSVLSLTTTLSCSSPLSLLLLLFVLSPSVDLPPFFVESDSTCLPPSRRYVRRHQLRYPLSQRDERRRVVFVASFDGSLLRFVRLPSANQGRDDADCSRRAGICPASGISGLGDHIALAFSSLSSSTSSRFPPLLRSVAPQPPTLYLDCSLPSMSYR
jgi:hypothetical protein